MKKILFIFVCLVLSGCVFPKFHEDTQRVSFKHSSEIVLTIEGYEGIPHEMQVKRSFSSLKGTLSKKGFKNKEIEIKAHFTDDKWARIDYPFSHVEEASGFLLIPLASTITFSISTPFTNTEELIKNKDYLLIPITIPVSIIAGFTVGLANDVRNLFTLSLPQAVLGNPWYEYDKDIDLTKEILTPTPEFEKECHSKKNTFIGNNDCLTCLTEKIAISTEEECNRCFNREWSDFECRLK